jgi:hypothetical protein
VRHAPPYQQLEALLWFLRRALRDDVVLQEHIGEPDDIVAATARHLPARDNGDILVWESELPVLCVWEPGPNAAVRIGPKWATRSTVWIVYAYRPYIGGMDDTDEILWSSAWSENTNAMIWDRVCHWLREGALDADGNIYSLLRDGGIHSIRPLRYRPLGDDEFSGVQIECEMERIYPSYQLLAPNRLLTIDLELHDGTTVPSEPTVEAQIDVPQT